VCRTTTTNKLLSCPLWVSLGFKLFLAGHKRRFSGGRTVTQWWWYGPFSSPRVQAKGCGCVEGTGCGSSVPCCDTRTPREANSEPTESDPPATRKRGCVNFCKCTDSPLPTTQKSFAATANTSKAVGNRLGAGGLSPCRSETKCGHRTEALTRACHVVSSSSGLEGFGQFRGPSTLPDEPPEKISALTCTTAPNALCTTFTETIP
jgi:hypothetical protein